MPIFFNFEVDALATSKPPSSLVTYFTLSFLFFAASWTTFSSSLWASSPSGTATLAWLLSGTMALALVGIYLWKEHAGRIQHAGAGAPPGESTLSPHAFQDQAHATTLRLGFCPFSLLAATDPCTSA